MLCQEGGQGLTVKGHGFTEQSRLGVQGGRWANQRLREPEPHSHTRSSYARGEYTSHYIHTAMKPHSAIIFFVKQGGPSPSPQPPPLPPKPLPQRSAHTHTGPPHPKPRRSPLPHFLPCPLPHFLPCPPLSHHALMPLLTQPSPPQGTTSH